jgi:hypothetical protein
MVYFAILEDEWPAVKTRLVGMLRPKGSFTDRL